MKCDKCGTSIDSELNICPVCGNIFSAAAASEEIQNEIGTKIDRILGDSSVNGLDDGVDMLGGKMEAVGKPKVSDTQEFTVPDTVFDPVSEKERIAARKKTARNQKQLKDQYHWDSKRDWEDIDDEAMLEKLKSDEPVKKQSKPAGKNRSGGSFAGQDVDKTAYRRKKTEKEETPKKPANRRKPHVREAKKAPGRSHAGLIAGIIFAILIASAIGVIIYTGVYKDWIFWETAETESTTGEDVLTCNVSEGVTYSLPLQITVESSAGNRIYYTLDGTEPGNNSLRYNGPIPINGDYVTWTEAPYTLWVVTYTSTSIKAAELKVNFTVRKPDLAAPVFSLPGGEYDLPQGVTISAETGSIIYYTYDEWGTPPTTESNVYRGTIEMLGGTKTLSAIAVNGDRISEVAQVTYTLNLAINFSYTDAYVKISSKLTGEGYEVLENEPTEVTTPETTAPPPETTKEGETDEEPPTTTVPETTVPPRVTMAVLYNSGTVEIGGANYYCIWVQLFYETGAKANGMYYGVDMTTGAIVRMTNSGGEFYLQ